MKHFIFLNVLLHFLLPSVQSLPFILPTSATLLPNIGQYLSLVQILVLKLVIFTQIMRLLGIDYVGKGMKSEAPPGEILPDLEELEDEPEEEVIRQAIPELPPQSFQRPVQNFFRGDFIQESSIKETFANPPEGLLNKIMQRPHANQDDYEPLEYKDTFLPFDESPQNKKLPIDDSSREDNLPIFEVSSPDKKVLHSNLNSSPAESPLREPAPERRRFHPSYYYPTLKPLPERDLLSKYFPRRGLFNFAPKNQHRINRLKPFKKFAKN